MLCEWLCIAWDAEGSNMFMLTFKNNKGRAKLMTLPLNLKLQN
jgi:hypothetical protein